MNEDILKSALTRRKKILERERDKQNSTFTYEDREEIKWCTFNEENKYDNHRRFAPLRFLGGLLGFNEGSVGTDNKVLLWSKVLKDNGKGFIHVNWPTIFDENEDEVVDKNWILYRMYEAINERVWDKSLSNPYRPTSTEGYWRYIHADSLVYKEIALNDKESNKDSNFHPRFLPSKKVLFNVIDRHDDWCATNKHSKAFSTKHHFWQNDKEGNPIFFTEPGMAYTIYNLILDKLVSNMGFFNKYDIVVEKLNHEPWYSVEEPSSKTLFSEIKPLLSETLTTDEELAYDLYDFDKLYPNCSYFKLKKNLSKRFMAVDAVCGTSFYEELCELATEEEKQRKALASESKEEDETTRPIKEIPLKDQTESLVQAPKRRKLAEDTKIEEPTMDTEFSLVSLPKWGALTEIEKKAMLFIVNNFDNEGVPSFKANDDRNEAVMLMPCDTEGCVWPSTNVKTMLPDMIMNCPNCGANFTS